MHGYIREIFSAFQILKNIQKAVIQMKKLYEKSAKMHQNSKLFDLIFLLKNQVLQKRSLRKTAILD